MPVWKINCLKTEDGTNPSSCALSSTSDEANKTEPILSSNGHQSEGTF